MDKFLVKSWKDNGWDFDGRTVVKIDNEIGMYQKATYEEVMLSSQEIVVDLDDDLVYNWMKDNDKLN